MAEGAGALVLESLDALRNRRGAKILGVIAEAAANWRDTFHRTRP